MGLIRKTLFIGSAGIVRPSSKKQRVAAKIARNTAASSRHTQQLVRMQQEQQAQEFAFAQQQRYATDPAYRAQVDQQRSAAEAAKQKRASRRLALLRATGRALTAAVFVVAVVVLAVLVWVPQMTIGKVRGKPQRLWLASEARHKWQWIRGNATSARDRSAVTLRSDEDR